MNWWMPMRTYWDPAVQVERRIRLKPAFTAEDENTALTVARFRWRMHAVEVGRPDWVLQKTYVVPATADEIADARFRENDVVS